jgi:predicted RNase H-like HicB family nuclease
LKFRDLYTGLDYFFFNKRPPTPGVLQYTVRQREFTAVIEKKGRWYVGFVEEIPGVNTQGRTLAEARRNLKEALSLILETNRKLAARDRSPDARREPITLTM